MIIHVITTDERVDRHAHIEAQFNDYPQYVLRMHSAPRQRGDHRCGSLVKKMVAAIDRNRSAPYCVIIEDDHRFTGKFSPELLSAQIAAGDSLGLDILLGGVEYFSGPVLRYHSQDPFVNIISVQNFMGMQFCVVYKKFYDAFLKMDPGRFPEESLSTNGAIRKGVIYPFVSIQEDSPSDFGREGQRRVEFEASETKMIDFFLKNYRHGVQQYPGNI